MKSKIGKRALAILLCMVIVLGGTEYMRAGSQEETETATPATSEEEIVLSEDGEQQAAEGETGDITERTDASADAQEQAGSEETGSESTGSADSTESESKSDVSAENGTSENNAASENGETKNETASTDTEKKEETAAQTTDTEKTTEELEKEKLEAEKPITELTYEDDQVSITVKADQEGNIPKGASLKVTPIQKTEIRSDMDADAKAEAEAVNAQYDETAEKLSEKAEGEDYDILGFLAYDISFVDENDAKLEPAGSVSVTMDYKEAAIPDEVKEAKENGAEISDVTLMHLEEDDRGEVKDVVDMVADESQTAEVKTTEETEVEKAEFKTESFSVFVLTWNRNSENSLSIQAVDTNGEPIIFFSYTDNWSNNNSNNNGVEVSNIGLGKGKGNDDNLKNYSFQKATLSSYNGTEIKYLRFNSSKWQYKTADENATWTNLGDQQVYFVYCTDNVALKDLDNEEVTSEQLQTMIQDAKQGSLPITWKRSESYAYTTGTIGNDNTGLNWTWSTISGISILNNLNLTNGREIWDGSRSGTHYLNKYLNYSKSSSYETFMGNRITASENTLYDSATWKISDGNNESLTRFQGTFSLKSLQKTEGYDDYTDYDYTIKSVLDSNKIFINDNLFVFVYPSDVTLTDDNYMDYLAFWTGTSNQNGTKSFHGKAGTSASQSDNSKWSDLTDKWYAEPVKDSAGDIIQKAVQDGKTDFIIDVIAHDNASGGGMYRLIIDAQPVKKTPVSLYKVNANDTSKGLPGATFTLTSAEGATYTLKTSDTSGKTDIVYLEDGSYTMVETTAPDGYQKSDNQWTVEVKNGTFTIELKEGTTDDGKATVGKRSDGSYYITNSPTASPEPSPDELGTPEHKKYIKDNQDGTYTLTLDVTGKQGDSVGADVLLVIDRSGSMGTNSQGKTDATYYNLLPTLKDVVEDTIVKDLFRNDEKNVNKLAAVSFSSDNYSLGQIETRWVNKDSSSTVTNAVNGLSAKGATNWQSAMRKAESKLQYVANDGNKKYVIFLSDGVPTKYYNSGYWGGETESGDGSKYETTGLTNAVNEVKNSTYLKNATIYSVYLTSGTSEKMTEFATKVNDAGGKAVAVDGTQMDEAIQGILNSILTPAYKNVTIEDELSEYAEFVLKEGAENPTFTVKAMNKDGHETTLDASKYTVTSEGKKFKLDLTNAGELEAGTTYSISVNIRPTTEAYAKYLKDGYTAYGDNNTDAEGNSTSSGEAGHRSNTTATLSYKVNGDDTVKTTTYPHPVIQVTPETVSHKVKKDWKGGKEDSVQVKLKATYQEKTGAEEDSASASTKEIPKNFKALTEEMRKTVTLNEENSWSHSWNDLPKYYYYQKDGAWIKDEISYTVEEVSPSDKYTVSYSDGNDDDGTPLTTITNTAKAKWQIIKQSTNKASDGTTISIPNAEFQLTGHASAAPDTEVTYTGISGEDGVVTWKDQDGVDVEMIPQGTYTLTETKAPNGYAKSTAVWTIDTTTGTSPSVKVGEKTITATKTKDTDTGITTYSFAFENAPAYALPSTGGIGTHWYTISGILLMLGAALMLYRYKKQ